MKKQVHFGHAAALLVVGALAGAATAQKYTVHSFKKQVLETKFFGEGATYGDLNRDGKMDVISGPYWYEGPDFKTRHEYYAPKPFDPHGYSDNFFAFVDDFNGDGWTDILIYGFPGKDASWFENPKGGKGHWKRHVVFDVVDNESPTWGDIDGDGKNEILFHTGGRFGYAKPDWSKPGEKWVFHPISGKMPVGKFTHGFGYGDINGDGRADMLWKDGWFEQPASLKGDPEWKYHPYGFAPGQGGAQMYVYDFDGDGDNDVLTSLAAHQFGLVWHENTGFKDGSAQFKVHTIMGKEASDNRYGVVFSQLHAIDLIDMDGDGVKDIVTGKRWWAHGPKGDPGSDQPPVLYWFKTTRKNGAGDVDFVPHQIDNDSGVGTQVVAGDLNGDKLPDVVVGSKKGTYVFIHEAKEVNRQEWLKAQPRPKFAAGLAPEDAAAAMTTAEGFSVILSAGEPDVVQPIAMALDERGRLWVAEAYSYPIRRPDNEARDRILVFEDTDGDGKFDKRKVFIEGLNLVSGLEVGFGGVWVGAAPYLMFIPDKDGDDVPDGKPQILLDGWAYQDTHETLNAFIWGPDGWLYGCHGVFTHSRVGKPGTADEDRKPINAGIWRYHPTRHEFEVFACGTSNPWGVDFNDRGQAFATACVIPHLFHIIQGGRYMRQAGRHFNPHVYDDIKTIAKHRHWVGNQWNNADRARSDASGGGHAHAGAMVYLGGAWPKQYHDQIFMNNIHGARINQDVLMRKGSGYEGDGAPDFIFANDSWSQIINLRYGPDGQAYMIDWYDKNQCHHRNENGHDRTNGRIFKVVYGKSKPVRVDLNTLSDAELVALQTNDNDWYVRHARKVLQHRAAEGKLEASTRGALWKLLKDQKTEPKRLRALWALHVTGGLSEAQSLEVLKDEQEYLRAWAIQLALDGGEPTAMQLGRLAEMARTDSAQVVRLYLASALQRLSGDSRWAVAEGLVAHSEDNEDHNLPLMYWYGIEPLVSADTGRAMSLARASRVAILTRYITRRAASDHENLPAIMAALSKTEGAEPQLLVLDEMINAFKGQAKIAMPEGWDKVYDHLIKSENGQVRERVEYIAVLFGDKRIFPLMRTTLADGSAPMSRRKQAYKILFDGRDPALIGVLHDVVKEPGLRTDAIRAMAAYKDPKTADVLLGIYPKLTTEQKQDAIGTLASRPNYSLALLQKIKAGDIPRSDLTAFSARLMANHGEAKVDGLLKDVWGEVRQTSAEKQAELAKYKKQLTPEVLAKAKLSNGRAVYTRLCGVCHVLHGAGGKIGPDLTGSNRADLDYILENILDPNAVVGKDYQLNVVSTKDGRAIAGMIAAESASAVTVRTPSGEEVVVAVDEIKSRNVVAASIMPEGQLLTLKPNEIRDLIAYLAHPSQVPLTGEPVKVDPATHRVAGAIEGEKMKVLKVNGGAANPQDMKNFGVDKWSGNAQLWWTGAKPGSQLDLALPVKADGKYEIQMAFTKARDYAIAEVYLDGKKLEAPIDFFNSPNVISTGVLVFGVHELKKGQHTLSFKITGANEKALKAYMVGLDFVLLEPQ